jgi:Flp pilus assembly protein, protease CpaA
VGLPVTLEFGLLPVLGVAAWVDVRQRRVPNGALIWGAAVFVLLSSDKTMGQIEWHLLGALIGLLVYLPFYAKKSMGAGDIKLMALVGVYLGPPGVLMVSLYAALVGGVMALLFVLTQVFGRRLPFAVAIGMGVLSYLWRDVK